MHMIAGRKIDGLILSKIILVGTWVVMYPGNVSCQPQMYPPMWRSIFLAGLTHEENADDSIVLVAYEA
jgi:hypothetical protein